ncbi:MAG: hypothetical protein LC775_12580, partial [Acidobacteria bacterium]|nr:hypothetical protein [Acidobacteriota bacterium]
MRRLDALLVSCCLPAIEAAGFFDQGRERERDFESGVKPRHSKKAMTLSAGTKLGRYEIRTKIGESGMGEVYL